MKKVFLGLCIGVALVASEGRSGLSDLEIDNDLKTYERLFKLAKSGDIDSQTMLGEMYLDGIGTSADKNKAFFWISKAANSGDSEAQYLLGFMYENGIRVETNLDRAASLYQKAAKNGDIMAKFNLALMYKEGKGVKVDKVKAYTLLQEIEDSRQKIASR